MLGDIDREFIENNLEPAHLGRDAELVAALRKAMALTRITIMTEEVRAFLDENAIIARLEEVGECTNLLYATNQSSEAAHAFDQFQQQFLARIREGN